MTLALLAGQGGVPPHLVRVLLARGEVPLVCEVAQAPSQITGDLPRLGFRLETFGSLLETLRARGIARLCIAGEVPRLPVDPAWIDRATAPLVPRLSSAMAQGHAPTLREIVAIIEEAGIAVIGAAEIAPEVLPEAGLLTGTLPDGIETGIADAGMALADRACGEAGQAAVIRGGAVVAREDARGTDAMLDDLVSGDDWTLDPWGLADQALGAAADWLSGTDAQAEAPAFLLTVPGPAQEMRVNMPVIGPDTARRAARAGLAGIVIAARGVMLPDRAETVRVLAGAGMFLWVRDAGRDSLCQGQG